MKQYVGRFLIFFCFFVSLDGTKDLLASASDREVGNEGGVTWRTSSAQQGDSDIEEGGVGSDDEDGSGSLLKVNYMKAENAEIILRFLEEIKIDPKTTAFIWDCDENLVVPVLDEYSILYSTEMFRQYEWLWRQVGKELEKQDPKSFSDLSGFQNFAFKCQALLGNASGHYEPVDSALKNIFVKYPDMDHAVCTGLPPKLQKIQEVHEKLYDFSTQYIEEKSEVNKLFYRRKNWLGREIVYPGWMKSSKKGQTLYNFYNWRSEDRARLGLRAYTNFIFSDNNPETLQIVGKFFKTNYSDLNITLTLIHFTKDEDRLKQEFEKEGRLNRMVEQYKRLVNYIPPVDSLVDVKEKADDEDDLIVPSDEEDSTTHSPSRLSSSKEPTDDENEENRKKLLSQTSFAGLDRR